MGRAAGERGAAGDALLAPGTTRRLIAQFSQLDGRPRAPLKDRVGDLTERETEVLALIARGLSNAEIAERLVVAERTVKTHVGRILVKPGSGTAPGRRCSRTSRGWCGRRGTDLGPQVDGVPARPYP